VNSELPAPPFDLERRSTCTAPVCRLDGWLPDAAFADTTREGVPSQGAVWLETLADESALVLPASPELESLAVVLEGQVAYGEGERAKAAGSPVLSAWSVLRAPGAGYSLAARGGKASVLVAVLSRSGTLGEAIARGRQKTAPKGAQAPLEVANLASAPKLAWSKGTNAARVTFGGKDGGTGASLSLLQVSGRAELPETAHPAEWEHIAILRGSGELLLGNAKYPVTPGAIFHVPRGALHGWKGGGEDLVALTIFSPGGPEQRYVEAASKEGAAP
jgi:quercetin dioxygenase-like cupin family protein